MPRYLLIRFSSLGDVALATAAARHIKQRQPQALVAFATKAAYAPLLQGQPDLDEVWPLGPQGLGALVKRAWSQGVDRVVDLHGSQRARLLAALAPAKAVHWQARTLARRRLVWKLGPPPAPDAGVAWRYVAAAAAALGEDPPRVAPAPRLVPHPEADAWARGWLAAQGVAEGAPLLAVSPGAAWATKRWPVERLAACLAQVAAGGQARVLLLGSSAEAPLLDALAAACPSLPLLRADAETADLRRLLALIGRSTHFLGHDSGPMHLAEALGVPLTALFGPTVRGFGFYPVSVGATIFERDLACRPCHLHGGTVCPLGHHDCLAGLEPGPVASHLRQSLGLSA
jgi:heptosyltransferase-2